MLVTLEVTICRKHGFKQHSSAQSKFLIYCLFKLLFIYMDINALENICKSTEYKFSDLRAFLIQDSHMQCKNSKPQKLSKLTKDSGKRRRWIIPGNLGPIKKGEDIKQTVSCSLYRKWQLVFIFFLLQFLLYYLLIWNIKVLQNREMLPSIWLLRGNCKGAWRTDWAGWHSGLWVV